MKMIALATLCVALALTACGKKEEVKAVSQPAAVQKVRTTPRPVRPVVAPTPVVSTPVTNQLIDACADKALATNGDTDRSARRIKVASTKKGVAGLNVTFAKGDTYWGLCKAALSDPQATKLAAAKSQSASLTTKVASLTTKANGLYADYTKVTAERTEVQAALTAANAEVASLQKAIDARPAKKPAATVATPAANTTPKAVTATSPPKAKAA